ncbi:MAG: hypothetical protein R2748_26755 [Bryobacterales bacterium]
MAFRQSLTLTRQWNADVRPRDQSLGQFDWDLDPLDPTRLPPAGSCMVTRRPTWPVRGISIRGPSPCPTAKSPVRRSAITLSTPAGEWTLSGLFYSTVEPAASSFLGVGALCGERAGRRTVSSL